MESYHYFTNKHGIEYVFKVKSASQAESRTDSIEPTEGRKSTYAITGFFITYAITGILLYHLCYYLELFFLFCILSYLSFDRIEIRILLPPFPPKLNARAFDRSAKRKRTGHQPPCYRGKVNLHRCANSSYFQVIRESRISKPLPLTRGKTSSRLGKDLFHLTSKKLGYLYLCDM